MTTFERRGQLRALIQNFLAERLAGKLETLKPDDPKRAELQARFASRVWLEDAANRSAQIQCATHTLKPLHPDARGSNLYVAPRDLPALDEVGSHCLGDVFTDDVVGNAAALDVYKFLELAHEGRTLWQLACANDADLAHALSEDPGEAEQWMQAFAALVQPRGEPATHGYAKQLYWLVGQDARSNGDYHLLAPLFGSSLAHTVWQTLQEHRFGDAAKEARQARKDGRHSETPVHEYIDLAVRKLGGTKPLNISHLNSKRGGNNFLLASLPPRWERQEKPPQSERHLLSQFGRRPQVRHCVTRLRRFLESHPARKLETRVYRDSLVSELLDEWIQFSSLIRSSSPGWSQSPSAV